LVQEFVHGSEARIESYHCYVDQEGRVAGEFTGRKIRTYPMRFGHTTALEITEAADVRRLGRDIVERLGISGVAKLDFKRDMQGQLRLLEINPRFTLWHHPAAIAGVNIPALVYADLTGRPRPAPARLRAGLRWCRPWKDFPAAREGGRIARIVDALEPGVRSQIDIVARRPAAVFARHALPACPRRRQARGDRRLALGPGFRRLTALRIERCNGIFLATKTR
jgi:hypothetical protein